MGAAASIDPNESIGLEKVKEFAGENWNEKLDARFTLALQRSENLKINDIRFLAPSLFTNCDISLDEAKSLIVPTGKEWNDELTTAFQSQSSPEGKVDLFKWSQCMPTLFETAEDRKIRLEEEYKLVLAQRAEGTVVINYQMYNEKFPISKNMLTASRIDEDYGLTDVMPGCKIMLSTIDSKARTLYQNNYPDREAPYVREDPEGTFRDLLSDETYYCIVIENPDQYKKDMAAIKNRNAGLDIKQDGSRVEGCSCLFGNPCVDQYICKDWNNRMTVAKKNGWKGF